jgi:VanZ family protein
MLVYLVRYKFSILLSGFIALISLLPSSSLPDSSLFSIGFLDKIVHFGMYSLLGFVALLETGCPSPCRRIHVILLSLIFLLSTLIEILQATVVATRSAEWLDLAANFTGLVAGYTGYHIIRVIRS